MKVQRSKVASLVARMRRHSALVILVGAVTLQVQTALAQPAGDAQRGRRLFNAGAGGADCMLCHGRNAEGGFGPDLAGRALTLAQFKRALQDPWGIMPKYAHLPEQVVADMFAFVQSLPAPAAVGIRNIPMPPAGAPIGQVYATEYGCAQCHGPEMAHPRRYIGEKSKEIDYTAFAKIVYESGPPGMGRFNPQRLPEPVLKEIYAFVESMGRRAFLFASLTEESKGEGRATYSLSLSNNGHQGSGLVADDITVLLVLPEGATVASSTGGKYEGVRRDADTYLNPGQLLPMRGIFPDPKPQPAKVNFAAWRVGAIKPGAEAKITLTLDGIGERAPNFSGSQIRIGKPEIRRLPNVSVIDGRLAPAGDVLWGPGAEFSLPAPPRAQSPRP